jgi:ankyrin repeat protein
MTSDAAELFGTIEAGDRDALARALDAGVPPGTADPWGETLLMHAAAEGQGALVALLLERGAPVDDTSAAGNSALMLAAAAGHRALVDQLLAAGAQAGRANKWGFTAADWAIWPENAVEIQAALRQASG